MIWEEMASHHIKKNLLFGIPSKRILGMGSKYWRDGRSRQYRMITGERR